MTNQNLECPLCRTDLADLGNACTSESGGFRYKCPVCGTFFISGTVNAIMRNNPVDYRLCAWIREHDEFKKELPEITTYFLDNILKNLPNYKTSEKQLLLLRAIERRTDHPGSNVVMVADYDYPLVWAKKPEEMIFLIKALADRKLIKVDRERLRLNLIETAIEPDGWDYLDKYSVSPVFRDRVFVAMSFDKSLEEIWENGIKPAITQAGYKPYRIDKEPHIDRIDAKIIADIKDSFFMVADVTQQKQGVYFEAGYALALNRHVIWCVREDDLCNVHFDTRQYNHIVWKTSEDLKESLYNLICAVIGKKES